MIFLAALGVASKRKLKTSRLFFILLNSFDGSSLEKVEDVSTVLHTFYSFGSSSLEKVEDVSAILYTFLQLWGLKFRES